MKRPGWAPPWYGKHIKCSHCGIYIIAFTPKQPSEWQREYEALTERASERCFCRKTYDELKELSAKPANGPEHSLYRHWINQAMIYRWRMGEGRKKEEW